MSFVTAAKRVLPALAALAALHPALSAQWKGDAAKLVGKEKNYRAAAQMLAAGMDGLPGPDKADAAALLAYCAAKMGEAKAETRWIVEYFDSFRAADSGFVFLDLIAQSEVIGYLNSWRVKYPWIMGISLIKGVGDDVIMPEGILPLVVEMANPGYYKFSENGSVIKAGLFNPGFNVIALDANALFLASGRHIYGLEIKSEGLILSRTIDLDVEVASSRAQSAPAPPGQSARPLEYTLIVYIGGEPVLESRKTIRTVPLQLGIRPNQNPFGFKTDYALNQNKSYAANSFNILNAVGYIYSLLKDLVKKRGRKDLPPPKIETVQDMVLTFRSKDFDGVDYESKISLKLASRVRPFTVRAP